MTYHQKFLAWINVSDADFVSGFFRWRFVGFFTIADGALFLVVIGRTICEPGTHDCDAIIGNCFVHFRCRALKSYCQIDGAADKNCNIFKPANLDGVIGVKRQSLIVRWVLLHGFVCIWCSVKVFVSTFR